MSNNIWTKKYDIPCILEKYRETDNPCIKCYWDRITGLHFQATADAQKGMHAMLTRMDYLKLTFTVHDSANKKLFDFVINTKKGLFENVECWIFPDNEVVYRFGEHSPYNASA